MKKFRFLLALALICALTVYALTRPSGKITNSGILQLPDTLLHSGDIIFRDGRGAISTIFRHMSLTDQSYSHAGIVHVENGETWVYHVIGGEGHNSVMRKEKLKSFCSKNEAWSIGIFRSRLNAAEIDSMAGKYYHDGVKFDDKFDLLTDDKMYCTELVYKILTKASHTDNFLPLTSVHNAKYCACDNIFLSPQLKKIYSYKYR